MRDQNTASDLQSSRRNSLLYAVARRNDSRSVFATRRTWRSSDCHGDPIPGSRSRRSPFPWVSLRKGNPHLYREYPHILMLVGTAENQLQRQEPEQGLTGCQSKKE